MVREYGRAERMAATLAAIGSEGAGHWRRVAADLFAQIEREITGGDL